MSEFRWHELSDHDLRKWQEMRVSSIGNSVLNNIVITEALAIIMRFLIRIMYILERNK